MISPGGRNFSSQAEVIRMKQIQQLGAGEEKLNGAPQKKKIYLDMGKKYSII